MSAATVDRERIASSGLFTAIRDGLEAYLRPSKWARAPLGLVVHVASWESPQPRFEVWPCGANPEAHGVNEGNGSEWKAKELTNLHLLFVDLCGSHKPRGGDGYSGKEDDAFPNKDINSDFAIFDRYFAREEAKKKRTPEAWLADHWAAVCTTPEVAMYAAYSVSWQHDEPMRATSCGTAYVDILLRFSETSQRHNYRNLNAHLLGEGGVKK